jgi:DNA-binding response OmpR family regulator
MNLLVAIENDADTYSDLENFCQGHRLRVVITTLNKRMVEYIKSASPDLIILGLSLEDPLEMQFMLELKKDPLTEHIPVLGLIAREDENFQFNYKILGFADYLIKPLDRGTLVPKILDLIKEYSGFKSRIADSIDSHIEILSRDFNTTIYLRSSLSLYVAKEIKARLNPGMVRRLRDDRICLDLRDLYDIIPAELKILENIINLFENKRLSIIAGKFLGILTNTGSIADKADLFMTPEDYEKSLQI